jgi:hypothetical protein
MSKADQYNADIERPLQGKSARWYAKTTMRGFVLLFATFGFMLTIGYVAVRFHWTNVKGAIDQNDRYYSAGKGITEKGAETKYETSQLQLWCKLLALQEAYPKNADDILKAYHVNNSLSLANQMLDAINGRLSAGDALRGKFLACETHYNNPTASSGSVLPWMESEEWLVLEAAIRKDAALINRVAEETDVEPRLIVAQVIGEQLRLYGSEREIFKTVLAPLKILGSETQFSLGVTGVKEETAKNIELFLQDEKSEFYPGAKYSHLLDFSTSDPNTERTARITDSHNHYYAYLYTALYIKEIISQWEKAGFPITQRPEIISTLFNIGFQGSHPNNDPHTGGSQIDIAGRTYTFGALGYEFYYSGELADVFPYPKNR